MMSYFIVLISLLMTLGFSGGLNDISTTFSERHNGETVVDPDKVKEIDEATDFSIHFNGKFISLKDWDDEVDMHEILGMPLSEEIEVLGHYADTHSGSYLKSLSYEGLEMTLFSPRQNGASFWVLSMEITSPKYATMRNITVGQSLHDLKQTYPGIEMAKDGRTDPSNCAYEITDYEKHLLLEVEEGIIKEIKLYYEIN